MLVKALLVSDFLVITFRIVNGIHMASSLPKANNTFPGGPENIAVCNVYTNHRYIIA